MHIVPKQVPAIGDALLMCVRDIALTSLFGQLIRNVMLPCWSQEVRPSRSATAHLALCYCSNMVGRIQVNAVAAAVVFPFASKAIVYRQWHFAIRKYCVDLDLGVQNRLTIYSLPFGYVTLTVDIIYNSVAVFKQCFTHLNNYSRQMKWRKRHADGQCCCCCCWHRKVFARSMACQFVQIITQFIYPSTQLRSVLVCANGPRGFIIGMRFFALSRLIAFP